MNQRFTSVLVVLLVLTGLFSSSHSPVNAQIAGNTFTSANFPYSLTWDENTWSIAQTPTVSQGNESLSLSDGISYVVFIASNEANGNARTGLTGILLGLNTQPGISAIQPMTDDAGNAIRQFGADRSYIAFSYTQQTGGTAVEFGAYLETRTLEPGKSILSALHVTQLPLYEIEAPVVQTLLEGITITTSSAPPSTQSATPSVASPTATISPESSLTASPVAPAASPIAPSPGLIASPVPSFIAPNLPQVFMSGSWRITLIAAERSSAIDSINLEERKGGEWIVLVVDVTNWNNKAVELTPDQFQIRYSDDGDPSTLAPRSTVNVAEQLNIEPTDTKEPIAFDPNQTRRLVLVYLADEGRPDPALTMRVTMPLTAIFSSKVDFQDLPPVTTLPTLVPASVDIVRDGSTLSVIADSGENLGPIRLIGVDAPIGSECFAAESARQLATLAGDRIYLETPAEAQPNTAYVWIQQTNGPRILVNRQLIAGGFAAHDPTDEGVFSLWMEDGATSAQSMAIGLWQDCTNIHGISHDDATATAVAEATANAPQPTPTATTIPTATLTPTPPTTPTATVVSTATARAIQPTTPPLDTQTSAGAMFRGDLARTGVLPGPGLAFVDDLPWTIHLNSSILAAPTVADGTLYVATLDRTLFAFSGTNDSPRWTFKTTGQVYASPTVSGGLIFVGCNDGTFYAINTETGKERWRFSAQDGIFSSPAVANGIVYFGSDDGNLYALDATTGQIKWRADIGSVSSSPAITNGTVYIGGGQNIYALDASTGEQLWQTTTASFISSSPAVVDGAVYIGNDGGMVFALAALTGQISWQYQTGGAVLGTPAVADGMVYVGSDDHVVYALNAITGEPVWTVQTDDALSASITVDNDLVYAASLDSNLYGLDAKTGAERWRFHANLMSLSPIVVDGVLYTATTDGTVSAQYPPDISATPSPAPITATSTMEVPTSPAPTQEPPPTMEPPSSPTALPPTPTIVASATPTPIPTPSPTATPAITRTLELRDLRFDPTEIDIPANTAVVFELTNIGSVEHNFTIDALSINVDVAPGESATVVINAPVGTYEYYCDVPGHRISGMVGTLTVK